MDPAPEADWLADAPAFQAWRRFTASGPADSTPFTIPGHHRRAGRLDPWYARLLDADAPLHGGLDTVKLTAGVLEDAERRAADLWGADWCRFSTGGSTHANQVAALALGEPGQAVLVARTAHRSTVSGLVLSGLRPVWLPAAVDDAYGIPAGVRAADVSAALDEHPDAVAVLVVEPSYLGTVGDVAGVVAAAHARGVPVVVDQAWGAHFGVADGYPPHAAVLGADVVVTSAHKTLPAATQGAVVLARTGLVRRDRLDRAYETSATTSPSGLVLASIDAARALLAAPLGGRLLADVAARLAGVRTTLRGLGVLVPGPGEGRTRDDPATYDPAKLVLCLAPTGASGLDVEQALLERGMPVEMADRDTVVPIVTLLDDEPALQRLLTALTDTLVTVPRGAPRPVRAAGAWGAAAPQACTPREAFFAAHEAVPRRLAVGRTSAELVAPYPPGVPVLVPGEVVTADALDRLAAAAASGVRIAYAADPTLGTLQVLVRH